MRITIEPAFDWLPVDDAINRTQRDGENKMMRKIVCVAALGVLALAGNAAAQCSDPDNWLSSDECGFDTPASVGPGAWGPIPVALPGDPEWGTPVHSATGGRTSPGTMQIDAAVNSGFPTDYYAAGASFCLENVTTSPGDAIGFGMYVSLNAVPAGGIYCEVSINTDTSTDCSVGAFEFTATNMTVPAAGTWTKVNETDTFLSVTSSGGNSVGLRVGCLDFGGTQDFVLSVDDAYVGLEMVPVSLQRFTIE